MEPSGGFHHDGTRRYRVIRAIGRGASGAVFEAELLGPMGFAKRVALKTIGRDVSERPRARLQREAQISALLEHPNIVRTYDLVKHQERLFLVLELLRGANLEELSRTW